MWRLSRHSIPSGDVLQRRNMATTSSCNLCGAHDTWRHALLNCPVSRSTWALSSEDILYQMSIHHEENAKEWIFAMNKALSSVEFVTLVVTLWAIWSARRKAMYEDIFKSPHAIHGHITAYLAEIQALSNKAADGRRMQQQQRRMGWIAPQDDFSQYLVLNLVRLGL